MIVYAKTGPPTSDITASLPAIAVLKAANLPRARVSAAKRAFGVFDWVQPTMGTTARNPSQQGVCEKYVEGLIFASVAE